MGTDARPTASALNWLHSIEEEPQRYDFYTVVRCIECAYPERPRLGRSKRPGDDPVRLGQPPLMGFASSSVSNFRLGGGDTPSSLHSYMFGLFGPHGPLPLHLTELARTRLTQAKDATLVKFLDLFHHRMLSFYYRAWADSQPLVEQDRSRQSRFAVFIGSLLGYGTDEAANRDAFSDDAKRYYAGLLSPLHRPAEGLSSLLEDYFGLSFELKWFVPRWQDLQPNDRARLVSSSGQRRNTLGQGLGLGSRTLVAQQSLHIVCGPLSFAALTSFLPVDGTRFPSLVAMIRNYAGDFLDWQLTLLLNPEDQPLIRLGRAGNLGWTSWLGRMSPTASTPSVTVKPGRFAGEQ